METGAEGDRVLRCVPSPWKSGAIVFFTSASGSYRPPPILSVVRKSFSGYLESRATVLQEGSVIQGPVIKPGHPSVQISGSHMVELVS